MQFLVDSLFKLQHVESKSLSDLIKTFSCDINNLDCMYGKCEKCKEINFITKDQQDNNEETSWLQWKTKKEKRNIKGDEKEITLTVKETVMDTFSTEMQRFKIHAFNIANQMKHYRNIKENLKPNEALVHVDFAENFQCKLANEIQSMHFGASKKHLTLHTGVFYTALSSQTFCAVSDSLDHNPCSVWAFMDPILDKLLQENKDVDTVHFFSDGPATQYKQKGNFLLFTHEMKTVHQGACNDKEGHRALQSPEIQVHEDRTVARKYYFSRTLTELGQCQTYEEILEKCENIYRIIDEKGYRIDYNYSPSITNTWIKIDERTHSILPSDIPHDVTLRPVKVSADGNCLPYSGSILVSGKEGMSEEIRVRIILESCIFKDAYLDQGFLERGFREKNNSLAKTFAFYSDEYANEALSNGEIEREIKCKETSFIMWTTTRQDMRRQNWVPNHFIVLLPMEQTGQTDYNENSTGVSDESVAGDDISPDRRGELNSGNEDVGTKEHTDNGDNPGGNRQNYLNVSDLNPQDLLGQYVLVDYDKKPYPGIVTDCDETEVFLSCMHRIGNLENPSFYWPLAVRDECWYGMENVLGTIPKPKLVGQKFRPVRVIIFLKCNNSKKEQKRYNLNLVNILSTCDGVIQDVARLLRTDHSDVNYVDSSLLRIQTLATNLNRTMPPKRKSSYGVAGAIKKMKNAAQRKKISTANPSRPSTPPDNTAVMSPDVMEDLTKRVTERRMEEIFNKITSKSSKYGRKLLEREARRGCTHLELYLRANLQVNVKSGNDNNQSGITRWSIGDENKLSITPVLTPYSPLLTDTGP
ncbi:unnamed protein product [Mytilus coruscus]|uniref:Uncharacterized protein n=1 Tax=Mytilus coruscus TaxID=42192 RepID=A0A6J8DD38_MYTCO|nr:unnamed protein product [Mytilus coruscus]